MRKRYRYNEEREREKGKWIMRKKYRYDGEKEKVIERQKEIARESHREKQRKRRYSVMQSEQFENGHFS